MMEMQADLLRDDSKSPKQVTTMATPTTSQSLTPTTSYAKHLMRRSQGSIAKATKSARSARSRDSGLVQERAFPAMVQVNSGSEELLSTEIVVHAAFLDIGKIDSVEDSVAVHVWYEAYWNDADVKGEDDVTEETWRPPLIISNAKQTEELISPDPEYFETTYQGRPLNMFKAWKWKGKLLNSMDLRSFPFDRDTFELEIDASDADNTLPGLTHTVDPIDEYKPGTSFMGFCQPPIGEEGEFRIIDVDYEQRIVDMGCDIKQLVWRFEVVRIPTYYLQKVVFLQGLITTMGLGAYLYGLNDAGDRMAYILTTLLANSAFMFVASAGLPVLPYLTTLDKVTIASFLTQFITATNTFVEGFVLKLESSDFDLIALSFTAAFYGLVLVVYVGTGWWKYRWTRMLTRDELVGLCETRAVDLGQRLKEEAKASEAETKKEESETKKEASETKKEASETK